jgi:ankyrin repeat protein
MEQKQANDNLMSAVIRGEIESAIEAIEAGASIHITSTKGNNLLYVAGIKNQEEMFNWLIDIEDKDGKKIDLNSRNNMGETALMEFIREDGFYEYAKKILEAGANPSIAKNDGMSPLIQACADKKFNEVQLLIDHKVDLNYVIHDTRTTAFLMASSQGSMAICEALKEAGADVNAIDSQGRNALITSINRLSSFMKKREKADHKALCLFLSDIGIDINYVAPSGATALWAASIQQNADLAMHLLEKGANADAWSDADIEGKRSVLHMWMSSDKVELVKKLIENGAKMNGQDAKGNTPGAIGFTNPFMRELMMEMNADVNSLIEQKTSSGNSVKIPVISIMINSGNKQRELISKMIDKGADVTFSDEALQQFEPILMAIKSSAYGVIEDLLKTGKINLNKSYKANNFGQTITPLELLAVGSVNNQFGDFYEKKLQYEAIVNANEENKKNGVTSKILDEAALKKITEEFESMKNIDKQLKEQRKIIFDTLISHGADVNFVNSNGRTPIFYSSNKDIAELIKNAGGNLTVKDEDGNDPLVYAVMHNKKELIEFLKEEYTINQEQTIEAIFYQLAFTKVEEHVQQNMLEKGIFNYIEKEIDKEKFFKDKDAVFNVNGINYQDEEGNSPLLVACANNLPFLASLYIRMGADINLPNNLGETPIMHAISTGNDRMVDFLVEKGVDLNAVTKNGKTIIDFAQEVGDKNIIEKIKIGLGHEVAEGSISGNKKLKM